ncbi:MAG: tRNA (adenosine(37)-N6)-threonylcarbamoyltransferase complex dimerization subunit type 1 TsaB [Bryobacteraceae bacterium]|nr:tRNA (adenosine(37)-N6)-threonylcarbamoyltransferase complex dimerization subunit type 1 TsaB [Bryobacteraceae bacterium]
MTRILAIDTTSEHGSMALLEAGRVLEERPMPSADGYGHVLFPQMEDLLASHGWELHSVDCFAAAAGPGSFTGIRVGLAAVKGLGEALGKPVCAVSNLQALALFGTAPLRAPFIDARRGEVYGGLYTAELVPVMPEAVLPPERWLASLPEAAIELIAAGFGCLEAALAACGRPNWLRSTAPRWLASAIGRIAARRLAAGQAGDAIRAEANYVRLSDAELFSKPL